MKRPKVITICGSLRFQEQMMREAERLELDGNCVLSVIYPPVGFCKDNYTKDQGEILDKMHKVKIDLSDAIFIVNVGGYIGDSTKSEIEYAKKTHKEIIWLEKPKDSEPLASKKIGVGVGVLVKNEKGQILLGLRNPDRVKASSELQGQGTWTMPGGKIDFGETLLEAAIRETKEETDLDIEELKICCISDDFSGVAHYVTVGFLATKFSGKVKTMEPETILEWKWHDIKKLPTNIYKPSLQLLKKFLDGRYY